MGIVQFPPQSNGPWDMVPKPIAVVGAATVLSASTALDLLTISGRGRLGKIAMYVDGATTANPIGFEVVIDGVTIPLYGMQGSATQHIARAGFNNLNVSSTSFYSILDIDIQSAFKSSVIIRARNTNAAAQNLGNHRIIGVWYE